jgi:hypothetical protein
LAVWDGWAAQRGSRTHPRCSVSVVAIHRRATRIEAATAITLAIVMGLLAALSHMSWHRWRLPVVQVDRFDFATSVVAILVVVAIAATIVVTARTGRQR